MKNLIQPNSGRQSNRRNAALLHTASKDVYQRTFPSGERARVAVTADGAIDLRIYDLEGRLVVSDTSLDHSPTCTWVPRSTESFTIQVRNCEPFTVAYEIEIN